MSDFDRLVRGIALTGLSVSVTRDGIRDRMPARSPAPGVAVMYATVTGTGTDIAACMAAADAEEEEARMDAAPRWYYNHAPTSDDDRAVGCELRAASGDVLAACLWSAGDLDIESDGCGVFADGSTADDIDWPDEAEAMTAVWG